MEFTCMLPIGGFMADAGGLDVKVGAIWRCSYIHRVNRVKFCNDSSYDDSTIYIVVIITIRPTAWA